MRQLTQNTLIYGVGTIGSRFIAFLLLPFLTFFLLPEEIGYYDLTQTTLFLLIPVVTLQLREAAFRFLLHADAGEKERYRHTLATLFVLLLIPLLLVGSVIPFFVKIDLYGYVFASLLVYCLYEVYSQAVRALHTPARFSVLGMICSGGTFLFSCGLLYLTSLRLEVLFLSNILARFLAIAVNEWSGEPVLRNLRFGLSDFSLVTPILRYSIPLLGSALSFTFIFSIGKYLINRNLGLEVNGYYAVAEKFAMIVQIAGISFFQAWQDASLRHYLKSENKRAIRHIFNRYALLLSLFVITLIFGVRFCAPFVIDSRFIPALEYVPLYATANYFYCLALFFEVGDHYTRKTHRILLPMIFTAILTGLLSWFWISEFGVQGVCWGMLVSCFFLLAYRLWSTRSQLGVYPDLRGISAVLLLLSSFGLYYWMGL